MLCGLFIACLVCSFKVLHLCEALQKLDDTASPHAIALGKTEEQLLGESNAVEARKIARKVMCLTMTTMLEHKVGQAYIRGGSQLKGRIVRYIGVHEKECAPLTKGGPGGDLLGSDVEWRSVMYKPMKDDIEKILATFKETDERAASEVSHD